MFIDGERKETFWPKAPAGVESGCYKHLAVRSALGWLISVGVGVKPDL